MKIKDWYIALFALLLFVYLVVAHNILYLDSFIISYQAYLVLRFINNIGYTICFFDFLCFYSAMDTLLMPLIGYRHFNSYNSIARVWGAFMRVDENTYYSFLIPANIALFLGVNFLIRKYKSADYKEMLSQLIVHARGKGKIGIAFTIIGFLCSFITDQVPSLTFVFHLCSMLKFVGPFYVYFSDAPFRKQIFFISIIVFLLQAIVNGLFGEFAMYVTLALLIVALRYELKFFNKLILLTSALFLVVVLQTVKGVYRTITWRGVEKEGLSLRNASSTEIFGTLFYDRLTNWDKLFDEKAMFLVYTRMNQGLLISRAMDYVPRVEPYANGSTILRTFAAIAVPRVLWPNKPESGGRENLSRFLGIKRRLGYSMNIGPYGEAYGNFGPVYGVLFIFFYGLLLSLLFKTLIQHAKMRPTLLIWSPLLLYTTLTVETDILSTLNFFVKATIFVVIVFWIAKKVFKVSL